MMEWMEGALCRGKHHDIWHPPLSGDRTESEEKYFNVAKMVCEHCPVQLTCAEMGEYEPVGVWGGTTPRERTGDDAPYSSTHVLIPRYLDKVPQHTADTRLDILELTATLKRYADKR